MGQTSPHSEEVQLPAQTAERSGLSDIIALLRSNVRLLVTLPVVVGALALAILLIRGVRYSADSTLRPQMSENNQSRLAGLAAQFGLQVPGVTLGDPVKLYTELATSRELLTKVLLTTYTIPGRNKGGDSLRGTLVDLWDLPAATTDELNRKALARLRKRILVSSNREAGLVYVRSISESPELSVAINRRLLDLLDESSKRRRQTQAGAEREFVEGRLKEAERELEAAETAQKTFLARNRRYQEAPFLQLEFADLQRRVELKSQVFTSLSQSYEQARLDEVRNTPLLVLVDAPEGSARRYGSIARDTLIWMLIGLAAAVFVVMSHVAMPGLFTWVRPIPGAGERIGAGSAEPALHGEPGVAR